jgi:hypothetical protein
MQVAIPMFIVLILATVPTYFWLSDVKSKNMICIVLNSSRAETYRWLVDT